MERKKPASHVPMLSKPNEVAAAIVKDGSRDSLSIVSARRLTRRTYTTSLHRGRLAG
jgi:hypothetical protein